MKVRQTGTVLVLALAGFLLAMAPAAAQKRGDDANRASKNGTASQKIGDVEVTITYGRPKVKERTIWGALVPYDRVWRTGADEATTVTFSGDVKVEGQALAAGTYSLFTLPTEGEWTVIFNKVANQWGAFNYKEGEDALRVSVKPTAGDHVEELTFSFDANAAVLQWEKLRVPIKIEG